MCIHCQMPEPTVVERDSGDLVMYCRAARGCGKSHWLFKCPDLKVPVYEQVCPFRTAERTPAASVPTSAAPERGSTIPLEGRQQSGPMQQEGRDASLQPPIDVRDLDPIERWRRGQIDVHELHGVPNLDERCASCGRARREHKQDCDQHGWRIARYELERLPRDWPRLVTKSKGAGDMAGD